MAIANFFDKIALGASQVLQNYHREAFERLLLSHSVVIRFDEQAAASREGSASLDLLVRLLARLYPNLCIQGHGPQQLNEQLESLARSINPDINLSTPENPTVTIIAGQTDCAGDVSKFFMGSDNWIARFSKNTPLTSGNSTNPFGAGAAACMAAANVFRFVFQEQLPHSHLDEDFSLSLFDFSLYEHVQNPELPPFIWNKVVLVGIGAIGNAVLWSFRHLYGVYGHVHTVDHEEVSLSNLQRYILAGQKNVDQAKTALAVTYLQGSGITVLPEPATWETFLHKGNNWNIETVLSCVDNAADRILMQGALPKKIFNAWTQQQNLGVSRHIHFKEAPCLCCLYLPTAPTKSRSQEIADNLKLSSQERVIRTHLANQLPVDDNLIYLIAEANHVDAAGLLPFKGASLEVFYAKVVCGGILVSLNNTEGSPDHQMQVPCAFESAMAGILLAAEFVKDRLGYSTAAVTTQFNLLRPISLYLHRPSEKNKDCICADKTFLSIYDDKWNIR